MLAVAALLLGAVAVNGAVSVFKSRVSSADDLPRYPTARRLGPAHRECPESRPFDSWEPTLQVADAIPLTYGVPVVDWEAYAVRPTVPFADVEAFYTEALARDSFEPDQAWTRWTLDYRPDFPGEVQMRSYVRNRTSLFGKDVLDVVVLLFQNDRDVNQGQIAKAFGPVYVLFYGHGPTPSDGARGSDVRTSEDTIRLTRRSPPYSRTSSSIEPDC